MFSYLLIVIFLLFVDTVKCKAGKICVFVFILHLFVKSMIKFITYKLFFSKILKSFLCWDGENILSAFKRKQPCKNLISLQRIDKRFKWRLSWWRISRINMGADIPPREPPTPTHQPKFDFQVPLYLPIKNIFVPKKKLKTLIVQGFWHWKLSI